MNSMIMSSRKALVAKPTQSRRVASKATRRPVMMAGMQGMNQQQQNFGRGRANSPHNNYSSHSNIFG